MRFAGNLKSNSISGNKHFFDPESPYLNMQKYEIAMFRHVAPSVHQNPATDNPFVAKNQNLYFRGRCIWFDFQKSSSYHKYLDHENTNNENVFR